MPRFRDSEHHGSELVYVLCKPLSTWRVGGLGKQLFYRVISIITPFRIPVSVLVCLLVSHLLSPPTLQVMNPLSLRPKLRIPIPFGGGAVD